MGYLIRRAAIRLALGGVAAGLFGVRSALAAQRVPAPVRVRIPVSR